MPPARPRSVRTAATSQAATSRTYSTTAAPPSATRPVCRASPSRPVTHVPTGNVNAHHVIANPMPRRRARTSSAAASASHSSAKPITGTPYTTASCRAYGTPGTVSANMFAAVVDWPSGPSTSSSVGVSTSGSGPPVTSRPNTSGSISSVASRLTPNMPWHASSSVPRHCPAGRYGASSGPSAADTIGATTGSSHTGEASSILCRTTIRYGIATAAARPIAVPAVNSAASSATAGPVPIQSRPRSSAPPPTETRAMARQP
ncbi:hypothetical protein GCM10023237_55530 [Streptomyces coeruleoprunus]